MKTRYGVSKLDLLRHSKYWEAKVGVSKLGCHAVSLSKWAVAIDAVSELGLPLHKPLHISQNCACHAGSPSKYEVAIVAVSKQGLPRRNNHSCFQNWASKLGLPRREPLQVWSGHSSCFKTGPATPSAPPSINWPYFLFRNWACHAVSPFKYEVAIVAVSKLGLPRLQPLQVWTGHTFCFETGPATPWAPPSMKWP